MYFVIGNPKSIEDLTGKSESIQNVQIAEVRPNTKILAIDNQSFAQKDNLQNHGYSVNHVLDLNNIAQAAAYHIILCDIHGVGRALGGENGGFLIKELRKNFPHKYIVAYSSHTFNTDMNEYFSLADKVMKKDADLEDWIDSLDDMVKALTNPIIQWRRARKILIQQGLRIELILHLEDEFVGHLETREALQKWQETKLIKKLKPAAQKVISDLVTGLLISKLTG